MTGYPIIVRHPFNLLSPSTWISTLIRFFTKSEWNHCAILLKEENELYVVEARSTGIVAATLPNWLDHRKNKVWKLGVPNENIILPVDMVVRIKEKFGKGYDGHSLFIWHPIRLLFGKWLGGKSPKGKLTCSEFVGLCWVEYFPENWYYLTTEDIFSSGKFHWGPTNPIKYNIK